MFTILFFVIFICDAVLALIKSIVLFYSLRIFFLSLDQFYFLPFRLFLIAYRSVRNCEDEWHYLVKVEIILLTGISTDSVPKKYFFGTSHFFITPSSTSTSNPVGYKHLLQPAKTWSWVYFFSWNYIHILLRGISTYSVTKIKI